MGRIARLARATWSSSGPVMSHDAHAPGYAVVGGPGGPEAPGYAVVGEAMVGIRAGPGRCRQGAYHGAMDPRMAAMGGSPGLGPGRSVGRSDQSAAGPGRTRVTAVESAAHHQPSLRPAEARRHHRASARQRTRRSTPRSLTARSSSRSPSCRPRSSTAKTTAEPVEQLHTSRPERRNHPAGIKAALGYSRRVGERAQGGANRAQSAFLPQGPAGNLDRSLGL